MSRRDPLDVLARSPLFAAVAAADLVPVLEQMEPISVPTGEWLMRQGDDAASFAIVLEGEADVVREDRGERRTVGRVAPGAIVGELALLRGGQRMATVTATQPLHALVGDVDAFDALLAVPSFGEAVARVIAQRLARNSRPMHIEVRDGTTLVLRPILPTDGAALIAGYEHLSPESQRRRFFSAMRLSESLVRYLVDVGYIDHFAWVATIQGRSDFVAAVARYVRDRAHPNEAELAMTVADELQGQGVGRVLLSALAAAAWAGGIERLTAEVLVDNAPMRGLLSSSGAVWSLPSAGVISSVIEVVDIRRRTPIERWAALHRAATEIITTAGLALADPHGS